MDYDGLTIAQLLNSMLLLFRSMFFSRARWKKSAPWGVRQDFYAQVLKQKNIGQDTININKYK
jgi:hypothetical protein